MMALKIMHFTLAFRLGHEQLWNRRKQQKCCPEIFFLAGQQGVQAWSAQIYESQVLLAPPELYDKVTCLVEEGKAVSVVRPEFVKGFDTFQQNFPGKTGFPWYGGVQPELGENPAGWLSPESDQSLLPGNKGQEETASSGAKGGLGWILGKDFFPGRVVRHWSRMEQCGCG